MVEGFQDLSLRTHIHEHMRPLPLPVRWSTTSTLSTSDTTTYGMVPVLLGKKIALVNLRADPLARKTG